LIFFKPCSARSQLFSIRAKSIFPLSGARFLTLSIPFSFHTFSSVRCFLNQASAVQHNSSALAIRQRSPTSDAENQKDLGFRERLLRAYNPALWRCFVETTVNN
jgi:hypothetical protein